jgi:hypothetical protein
LRAIRSLIARYSASLSFKEKGGYLVSFSVQICIKVVIMLNFFNTLRRVDSSPHMLIFKGVYHKVEILVGVRLLEFRGVCI